MPASMHRLSRELVWWKIKSTQDLSGVTAEVALLPTGTEPTTEWVPANVSQGTDGAWWVSVLVSGAGEGGDIDLEPGDYQAWVRLTDATERPVRKPGVVTIS